MGIFSKVWKALTGWLKPKLPKPETGFNLEKKGANQPIPVIYGFQKKVPCIKVFKVSTDERGGADNEYLHFICIFCEGDIERIGTLYFNDISENQIPSERYFVRRFTGSDTQAACTELTRAFPRWRSTAKLSGLAYAYVRVEINEKGDWWGGEPSISADIYGKKILDVRDGQIKYSTNLPLCVYDYLTNARYGKGLAAHKVNASKIAALADLSESQSTFTRTVYRTEYDTELKRWIEVIEGTENELVTENLFNANATIDTTQQVKANVEELLAGMRGVLIESDGQYQASIETDDAPVFAFTQSNLASGVNITGGNQNKRYNVVVIRFRNNLTGEMDEVTYPETKEQREILRIEDGGTPGLEDKIYKGDFTFDTIGSKAEALQMGHVVLHRSRNQVGAKWIGQPETIVVEAGDVATVPSKIAGWTAKPMRIELAELDLDNGLVHFQGVEHQATIYPWAISAVIEEYADTTHALPQFLNAPTGLAYTELTDDVNQGLLSWHKPNNNAVIDHKVDIYRGSPSYLWLIFADSATGAGISAEPTGKSFVGIALNQSTADRTLNPDDYQFYAANNDAIRIEDGLRGEPRYLWLKFAGSTEPTTMQNTPNIAVGYVVGSPQGNKSTDWASYTWQLVANPIFLPHSNELATSQVVENHELYIPRLPEGSYTAEITARNNLFISKPAFLALDSVAPQVPNGLTVKEGLFDLVLYPTINGQYGTTLFELVVSDDEQATPEESTSLGRGYHFNDNNLPSGHTRYYFARSINAAGISGWSSRFSGTTSTENENLRNSLTELGASNFTEAVQNLLAQVEAATVSGDLKGIIDGIKIDVTSLKNKDSQAVAQYQQIAADAIAKLSEINARDVGLAEMVQQIEGWQLQINEDLQQLTLNSGNILPSEWTSYKLLVDGLNANLTSVAAKQTIQGEDLVTFTSTISQLSDRLTFIEQSTEVGDFAASVNEVKVELDAVKNQILLQSESYRVTALDQINTNLLRALDAKASEELRIDFAVAKQEINTLTDENKAQAKSVESLTSNFDNTIAGLHQLRETVSSQVFSQLKDKKELVSQIKDETSQRTASINELSQTQVDDKQALTLQITEAVSALEEADSTIQSSITQLSQTQANDKQALTQQINQAISVLEEADSTIQSSITQLSQTQANDKQALTQQITDAISALEQADTTINAALTKQIETQVDDNKARVRDAAMLSSRISQTQEDLDSANEVLSQVSAEISQVSETQASDKQALTQQINQARSDFESADELNTAAIDEVSQTVATKASSTALNALKVRVQDEEQKSASAELIMSAMNNDIDDLKAEVFLGVDINGRITGIHIAGDTTESEIEFLSSKVSYVNPFSGLKDLSWNAAKRLLEFVGAIKAGTSIEAPQIKGGDITLASGANTLLFNQHGFLLWYGKTTHADSPSASNAIWFLDNAGNYKKDVSRTKATRSSFGTSFTLTPSKKHYVVGGSVELEASVNFSLNRHQHGESGSVDTHKGAITVKFEFYHGNTKVGSKSSSFSYQSVIESEPGFDFKDATTAVSGTALATVDTSATTYSSQQFSVQVTITDSGGLINKADSKNLSAKFTTFEIA